MKRRIAVFILMILIGLAGGLYYGWVVNPRQSPAEGLIGLRLDYKTDCVLMAAEIYHTDGDLQAAVRRVAMLGSDEPVYLARQMYLVARDAGYPASDLVLIDDLAAALQAMPSGTPSQAAP